MRPGGGYRFFRVIGYRTNLKSAQNALGYAAFRSEAVKGKGALIFDERTDSADVRSFTASLDDPITSHSKVAKAYHALFSLPRDLYERGAVDWRDVVRQVLKGYELETGKRLKWIGVTHDDPKHPHAHVVIKATYTDQQGRNRRLFLGRPEVERIKDQVGRALEARGIEPTQPRRNQSAERNHNDRGLSAAGAVMGWIEEQIRASQHRKAREMEEARRTLEREQERRSDRGR